MTITFFFNLMRTLLLAACGLLLTITASAQTEVISPEALTTIKPPRLLQFRVGLTTGLQAIRPTAGGTTRLAFTNGLSGIVGLGNRYEIETGVALTMGGRGDRNGQHPHPADPSTPPAGDRHPKGGPGRMALTVPLKLNAFVWTAGPLRAFVSGGVVTNLGGRRGGGCHDDAATTATTTTTSETTTTTTAAPRVAVAATVGFGLEYRPCSALSVRLEPQGRFDLQSAGRTWGGGLRLGTYWSF